MKKYTYLLAAMLLLTASSCKKFGTYTCECISGGVSGNFETELHTFTNTKAKAQEKCDFLGKDVAVDGPHCRLLD